MHRRGQVCRSDVDSKSEFCDEGCANACSYTLGLHFDTVAARIMVTLSEAFNLVAVSEGKIIIKNPGVIGLCYIFAGTFFPTSVAAVDVLYEKESLPADASFTWEEFLTFAAKLGWQVKEERKRKREAILATVSMSGNMETNEGSVGMSEALSWVGHNLAKEPVGLKELEYIGSAPLLYGVARASEWMFEGRLIECRSSGMPNSMGTGVPEFLPKRRRIESVEVLAGDRTGPVMLSLLDESASVFMDFCCDEIVRMACVYSFVVKEYVWKKWFVMIGMKNVSLR